MHAMLTQLLDVSPSDKNAHIVKSQRERAIETERTGRGFDDWYCYLAMAHGRRKDDEEDCTCTAALLLRGDDAEAWKEEEWHHHHHHASSSDLWRWMRRVREESRKLWEVVGPAIFTRAAIYSLNVVMQAVAGHLGDLELASVSFACTVLTGFNYGLMVSGLVPSFLFLFLSFVPVDGK